MIQAMCCIVSAVLPLQIRGFVKCLEGPASGGIRPLCCSWCDDGGTGEYSPFDLNADGLVDLADYAEFQVQFQLRTGKRVTTSDTSDVWDSTITRERWLLVPTRFLLVSSIPGEVVRAAMRNIRTYCALWKQNSVRMRVAGFADVLDVLEETVLANSYRPRVHWYASFDRRFVDLCLDREVGLRERVG